MQNKLEIQLGEYKIVAEINAMSIPEIPPELNVSLQDKTGAITQNICLVRPHYGYKKSLGEFETDNDFVDCLVWGDSNNEDFSDNHIIAVYKEEE